MSSVLPSGYASLEPFVLWAGETAADRARLRDETSAAEKAAFYAAAQPLAAAALDELDRKPLAAHDENEQRLMRVMLALAHVSVAVEVQKEDESAHARLRPHMRLTRAPADV